MDRYVNAQRLDVEHKGSLTASQKVWLFATGCRKSYRESGAYGREDTFAEVSMCLSSTMWLLIV